MISRYFASCSTFGKSDECSDLGQPNPPTPPPPPPPPSNPGGNFSPDDYILPFNFGESYYVTQGRQGVSHWNKMEWALDFGTPEGTPIVACHKGKVRIVKSDASGKCGGSDVANDVNYVVISHDNDGTETQYLHLKSVSVSKDQRVNQGQVIGYAGKTGWTECNAHLHWQRQTPCDSYFCQSLPAQFVNLGPAGEPQPLQYNKYKHKVTNLIVSNNAAQRSAASDADETAVRNANGATNSGNVVVLQEWQIALVVLGAVIVVAPIIVLTVFLARRARSAGSLDLENANDSLLQNKFSNSGMVQSVKRQ